MPKQHEPFTAVARFANVVLATGTALASTIFLRFVYQGWSGLRTVAGPLDAVLYYVCPLSLVILLLASFKLRPDRKAQLALVGLSVTASLYGLELLLESKYFSADDAARPVMTTFADSNDKAKAAAELTARWGNTIDTRTADEVIADFRARNVEALPIITPSNHLLIAQPDGSQRSAISVDGEEVLPLAAVSNTVTVLCNENGQWIDYRSDQRGFSNPDEIWQSDRLDIAALGDSFTQGYCVPADKAFVALIRKRYPATLNLGIAGDGPLLMLAKLKEYVSPRQPRIVLWFYFEGNDLADLQRERQSMLLRNYLDDSFAQSALSRQADLDHAIANELPRLRALEEYYRLQRQRNRPAGTLTLKSLAYLSVLRGRLGLVGGNLRALSDEERGIVGPEGAADLQTSNLETFRDVVRQAKRRVDGWGGRLYFVYLPEWSRYAGYPSFGISRRSGVLDLVTNLGIPIIDLDATFRARADPLSLFPFRATGHYNETGHQVVAAEVLKSISLRP